MRAYNGSGSNGMSKRKLRTRAYMHRLEHDRAILHKAKAEGVTELKRYWRLALAFNARNRMRMWS